VRGASVPAACFCLCFSRGRRDGPGAVAGARAPCAPRDGRLPACARDVCVAGRAPAAESALRGTVRVDVSRENGRERDPTEMTARLMTGTTTGRRGAHGGAARVGRDVGPEPRRRGSRAPIKRRAKRDKRGPVSCPVSAPDGILLIRRYYRGAGTSHHRVSRPQRFSLSLSLSLFQKSSRKAHDARRRTTTRATERLTRWA